MIEDLITKYWGRVDVRGPDECWPWLGARNEAGYGKMFNGRHRRARKSDTSTATHIALALDRRPRPSPEHVAMHRCDRPWCVNPAHLKWGTHAENMEDMRLKGRAGWQGGALADRFDAQDAAAEIDAAARALRPAAKHSKLTEADVRMIRSSTETNSDLARHFGVSWECIKDVRRRRTWQHVD